MSAPGTKILTLVPNSGVDALDGTSFAAPFVAGVAGLLAAMKPDLSGDQLKDYVLRGAEQPRVNAVTGSEEPAPKVGSSDGRFVDAYGAVQRLAKDHPGTPICGFPVSLSEQDVVLERRTGAFENLTVPGSTRPVDVRVAQGGRILSVAVDNPATNRLDVKELSFRGGQLFETQHLDDLCQRIFLESDTVDVRCPVAVDENPTATIRRADGSVTANLDLARLVEPTADSRSQIDLFFAPSGEYAVVHGRYSNSVGCPNAVQRRSWHVVKLPSGPVTLVREGSENVCIPPGSALADQEGTAAWASDSRRFVVAVHSYQLSQPHRERIVAGHTTLIQKRVTSSAVQNGTETIVDGRHLFYAAYSVPDNAVLRFLELTHNAFDCSSTSRGVANPSIILSEIADECLIVPYTTGAPLVANRPQNSMMASQRQALRVNAAGGGRSPQRFAKRAVQVN